MVDQALLSQIVETHKIDLAFKLKHIKIEHANYLELALKNL